MIQADSEPSLAPDFYRFSPIRSEQDFQHALTYTVEQARELALRVIGHEMPIDTLKLFAHYPDEYEFLVELLKRYGPISEISSKRNTYVDCNFTLQGQHIAYLGVRTPDPYRLQVGCADFPVDDYADFSAKHLGSTEAVREIRSGDDSAMLELWHPDYDVLGYVVTH